MDRLNFYFRQKVGGNDFDDLQENIQEHFEDVLSDILTDGLIQGGDVSENDPQDMTVLVSSLLGYGAGGERIRVSTEQEVDCSEDVNGDDTSVEDDGNEKWISVYVDFDWDKHDSRTDGNGDVVEYRWDRSYKFEIIQGDEAEEGEADKPDIRHDGSILLADILLEHGQTQISDDDIDDKRKQQVYIDGGEF